MFHATPVYDEYSGRRTGFREADRFYGPPTEEVVYARAHEGSHNRQYSAHVRQVRYAEDDGQRAEFQYPAEPRPRQASGPRGQSAADRFLEEFVPEQPPADDEQPLPPSRPESKPVLASEGDDGSRFTPTPTNLPPPSEPESQNRPLAPPQQAPSTVSNQSGYEPPPPNGRHGRTPDYAGPPRRPGPQRRRDRPQEHRMPSRYYRYMSVAARDEHFGRAPSITRSQRSRYEEQRRRIDEAETPQPTTEGDRTYERTYSRDRSVEHAAPDDHFYPSARPAPREYVSVQDRAHHFSPPRYHHYEERRGPPPPMYYPEPEYEYVRVRSEYRQPRPYMAEYRQPGPVRYEPYHDPYVYERPPQRHNSRPEEYYYEDRERDRPLPRRPVHEPEPEPLEPPPVGVKIEVATPAPGVPE